MVCIQNIKLNDIRFLLCNIKEHNDDYLNKKSLFLNLNKQQLIKYFKQLHTLLFQPLLTLNTFIFSYKFRVLNGLLFDHYKESILNM